MEMMPLDRYESGEAETTRRYVPWKLWLLYAVVERVHCDWLGSGYRFVRYRNGLIRRFWTRAQAQARADKLNAISDARFKKLTVSEWAESHRNISAAVDPESMKERREK